MAGKRATERGGAAAAVGLLALTMALWGGAFRATAVGAKAYPHAKRDTHTLFVADWPG